MFSTRTRATVVAVTAASALLLAAGCADDTETATRATTSSATSTETTAATAAEFNDADVTFLQMMYPHHAQAVEMAQLVPSRTQNQELIALAAQVEQAQAPEMAQITALLAGFGKPAPSTGDGHDGHTMPGMMSGEQMAALESAQGAEFDRQWLEMMIEHHEGAVEMARTELADGVNPESRQLATTIVADQEKEIGTMRGMLGQG
ncbi:DUF305 domain-containing protein [Nocardia rhizosphaerae]|uniref:DUF305 domain-containing protein n=1 Tax=Nocardia rhizosphaerae TaxID=1691571 RepID=A0ABV8L583_9NOCA